MMRADELAASGAIGCLGLPVLSEREALATALLLVRPPAAARSVLGRPPLSYPVQQCTI